MNNNQELDQLVESFLTPKSAPKAMELKELFALFDELITEQGFTGLTQMGTEKPLRGAEQKYKTDFFSLMQAALGEKIVGASTASDSVLQIIEEINNLKNKENWKNYKLSQTISVITFVESLYEMIYNIQGDNPDVAGKMFERFIAFATKGRVSSQIPLVDPELAGRIGASDRSIFDLITNREEYVSVKLLKNFEVTGSINNLYKYLFNIKDNYIPIDIEQLQSIKTNKSVTYLITIKGQDKEQLTFYSFIINCDNFVNVVGNKRIENYNNSVLYKEKIESINQVIEKLKEKASEIDIKLTDPATKKKNDLYYELRSINKDIESFTKQKENLTKGSTSFTIYKTEAQKYKTNLWESTLKVESGERDLIVENSKEIFNGKMKGLIDEATAVYYKVSNLLLKLEDENVSLEEKISTGKEAHNSIKTLENYLLSVTKEYNIALKDKKMSKEAPEQAKLFT